MGLRPARNITTSEMDELLDLLKMPPLKMRVANVHLEEFTSIDDTTLGGVSYLDSGYQLKIPLSTLQGFVIFNSELVNQIPNLNSETSYVFVDEPRYLFAYLFSRFQPPKSVAQLKQYSRATHKFIHPSVDIAPSARIQSNVHIGMNSVIGEGVCIHDSTVIGKNVKIKDTSVIGGSGFGYAVRRGYKPLRIPHMGGVIIGDGVDIGSCSTIDRGTFGNTVLSNDVKIDNGVHIAHNSKIGERTIITAHAEISGGVNVGQDCWIAPNASIREKVIIGDNVLIGIGSVVIRNVESNLVVAGVPARQIRNKD
jgi:UDP-3-O-[3-hydroxymyristoyl] glucosamine N-acyltransferase